MKRILTQAQIRSKLRKQWDSDNSNYYNYHAVERAIGDELDNAVVRIKELEGKLEEAGEHIADLEINNSNQQWVNKEVD